jgi:GPH family glycoside/pentoside/hexuronide:cation symporter
MVLVFFAIGLLPFALPFYVKYTLHAPPSMISILSSVSLVASLAAIPLWTRLVKRWGLPRVFFCSIAGTSCALLLIGLVPNVQLAPFATLIYGLAVPGIQVSNIVIRAELVSRSTLRMGSQNEGFYYGMMNFALRLGGLLQALAMFLAAQFFGYTSGETPGPHPDLAFRFLMGFLPVAGLVLASAFARSFFKSFSHQADSRITP